MILKPQQDYILQAPRNITRKPNDKKAIMTRDIWESSDLQKAHGCIVFKTK